MSRHAHLTAEEVGEISKVQARYDCSWSEAFEIWNEDTTYMENGE